jgi:ATP-dependent Clp protease ATP-binding subunit ClpA
VSGVWDQLTPAARQVMSLAEQESEQLGQGYIGDEHVLLGLLRGQPGRASSLLRRHGLDLAGARAELGRLSADQLDAAFCREPDARRNASAQGRYYLCPDPQAPVIGPA